MNCHVEPLTAGNFQKLIKLFGNGSACRRCYCQYWQVGSSYLKDSVAGNQTKLLQICQKRPPGLIAINESDQALGWCHVTPRSELGWLASRKFLHPIETSEVAFEKIWSISCFQVHRAFRRRGITAILIEAAVEFARQEGALVLEAYPVDATKSRTTVFTGYATTFARLGFVEMARRTPSRPVVWKRLT
jgi:GNAT superfamily N-acetyltransferase